MSALRAGCKPVLRFCALCALTAVAAGCASHGSASYTAQNASVAPPARMAQAAAAMEDDGLPSQAPPPKRIRSMPDEPAEPFSKNYGGGNPAALGVGTTTAAPNEKVPLHKSPLPDDLPPAFRQKLTAVLNQDE